MKPRQHYLNEGAIALADSENCIALDFGWAKAYFREGAACNVLKGYKNAAEAFARALDLDPGNKEIEEAYRAAQDDHDGGYY